MTAAAVPVAGGRGATGLLGPWRAPLLIVVFVLVAGAAVALLQPRPGVPGYLSPDSTDPGGSRALADILASRGHLEHVVTTASAAVAAATAGTTLVITSPYLLTSGELGALGRTRADLVIAEPDRAALAVLAPRLTLTAGGPVQVLSPFCSLRAAVLAGPADLGGLRLRVGPGRAAAAQCYLQDGLATLVRFRASGRLVTVLGSGIPLTNSYLARQGNAALGINLLSSAGGVTWLVPATPAAGTQGSGPRPFTSLVPLAAYLIAIQLGVAAALAALWRARRLGPLVTERLPVVVRASETVEGHGRLYRSRQARGQVAATLREAALARLGPAIGLPGGASPGAVTAALAARSTLDEPRLAELLYGPAPGTDAALVALAGDLDALEGEVRTQ